MLILVFTRMLRKDGRKDGRMDGSVTISLCNFVGEGITKDNTICVGHHHTQNTRRRQTKKKHNTICVGHHYAQSKTNNVNKT